MINEDIGAENELYDMYMKIGKVIKCCFEFKVLEEVVKNVNICPLLADENKMTMDYNGIIVILFFVNANKKYYSCLSCYISR